MSTLGSLDALLGLGGLTAEELRRLAAEHAIVEEHDLATACRTNRLRDDPAFGPARQVAIRRGLSTTPWGSPRRHLADARAVAARLLSSLQNQESAVRLAPVGAVRRMEPWVDEVELLASAHEPEALVEAFVGLAPIESVIERTQDRAVAALADGTRVTLTVLPEAPEAYIAALIERTGPALHVETLRARARERGLSFEARGLCDANGPMPVAWEPDIYTALELEPIPPELRHVAPVATPPADLVTMRDVQGLFHVHTDDGAGSAPLAGYARAAEQNGFAWVVVADRGLDLDTLRRQQQAAAAVHAEPDRVIRAIVGAEVGIGPDGVLEAEVGVVEAAALVIAAVEGGVGGAGVGDAGGADPTPRYVAAARIPEVHVLAHPRTPAAGGPAAPPDWARLLPALAETGTALELSGESARLELAPTTLRQALDLGVRLMPGADAHDLGSIDRAIVAVGQARRAAARIAEVLPTLSADELTRWAAR